MNAVRPLHFAPSGVRVRFRPRGPRGCPSDPDIACLRRAAPGCGRSPRVAIAVGDRAGFTLVEVLMALVIFAMAAVVLGSSYVNVLTGYDVAARGLVVDEDVAHARQLVLNESDREKVEDGGEFDTADGRRAKWSVEITSTNMPDLFNVAFTCEIPDPNRPEPVKVVESFVLLRPTWSNDAGERGKLKEQVKTKILDLQTKLQSAAGATR